MPLLSIITVNLNNKAGLERTIASVLSQKTAEIEFIVVDGASADGSAEIIGSNHEITAFVSEKDKGIYDAQNKGIMLSKGEYLLFLNSGDLLCEKILSYVMPELKNEEIVYGDIITLENGKRVEQYSFEKVSVNELLLSTIWHPCAFIRRELFDRYGFYNAELKLAGDYEFFVRTLLKFGASSRHVPKAISVFDMSGVSNDPANKTKMEEEREKAWQLNFSEPMIRFFKQALALERSGENKIGKIVTKFLPK